MMYDHCNCPRPERADLPIVRKRANNATFRRLYDYVLCLMGTEYDHYVPGTYGRHETNPVWVRVYHAYCEQLARYHALLPVDWAAMDAALPEGVRP